MESKVDSEWVVNYFPTSTELRDFKTYIKKIANDGAAKISVPIDLMVDHIPIEESSKLNHVQIQKVTAKQLADGSTGMRFNWNFCHLSQSYKIAKLSVCADKIVLVFFLQKYIST